MDFLSGPYMWFFGLFRAFVVSERSFNLTAPQLGREEDRHTGQREQAMPGFPGCLVPVPGLEAEISSSGTNFKLLRLFPSVAPGRSCSVAAPCL